MVEPFEVLPATNADGSQRYSEDGAPLVTRFWPKGASLADAGFRELQPGGINQAKEERHMTTKTKTAAEKVNTIAKAMELDDADLSHADAVSKVLAEHPVLYAEYMREFKAGIENPETVRAAEQRKPADALERRFSGDSTKLLQHERSFDEQVDELLVKEGKHTPNQQDRADATARLLESRPELYSEYVKAQRRAIGGNGQ